MICERCGTEFQGKFCTKCGQKGENKLFENLKKFVYDDSECILSVLGNNSALTFISTGVLGNGFAILTNKRIYFRGNCLIRNGKRFYSKIEEKSVDVADVTGTGFVHNEATWAMLLSILCLAICLPLFSIMIESSGPDSPILFLFFFVLAALFWLIYKGYNFSAFEISYAGGGIGFDMHWINEAESHEFQKSLNLLKDKIKNTPQPVAAPVSPTVTAPKEASVPEQLKQYKDLLDSGVITQEEFDIKKKQLLGI